jgi:hypothetical protein
MDPKDPDSDLQHWKVGTDFSDLQNKYSARDSVPLQWQNLLHYDSCAGAAKKLREAGAAGLQLL